MVLWCHAGSPGLVDARAIQTVFITSLSCFALDCLVVSCVSLYCVVASCMCVLSYFFQYDFP